MSSKIAFAAAALAACWGGAAAAAQPGQETVVTGEPLPTAIVRYGDLDLARGSGVAALHARVRRAAGEVCPVSASQVVGWRMVGAACRRDAIAGAQDQIAAAIAGHGDPARLAAAALVIRIAR